MNEERPTWFISRQPNTDWSEADAARFDGTAIIPNPLLVFSTPALDPQQEPLTTEQLLRVQIIELRHELAALDHTARTFADLLLEYAPVYNAARLAVPNIETVFRLYGHTQTHPLPHLRALLDRLTPPAPEWQAKEENE